MSKFNPEHCQPPFGGPHGWVQWKDTDVCMDIYCACGTQGHVDADFVYAVKCKDCGQLYVVNGCVKLHPVDSYDGCPPKVFNNE